MEQVRKKEGRAGEGAGKGEDGTAAASWLRRVQHRRFALFFPSAECAARHFWRFVRLREAPQLPEVGAFFVRHFLSARKEAVIDTLMRDVDVGIDCPCSSSWQSFEVLLKVHLFPR